MEELAKDHHHLLYNYIDNAAIFKKLTQTQKNSLSSHMHEVKFDKDTTIFHLGEFANCIYLIKSGEVEVTVPKRTTLILKAGDIFGEGSLKSNSIRKGQAKALTNAHCFVISRTKLSLCIEAQDIDDITFHCIIRWALKRTSQFANIGKDMIEKII
jgi:CRP-like cAMP-binding protein